MLVRFFKSNQVYIYAIIPLVLLVLRWPVIISEPPFTPSGQLPFLADLLTWLSGQTYLNMILSAICITYQAYVLSEISNEHRLIPFSSNLVAFILALSYSIFAPHHWFSPVILSNLFIVLAIERIMNIYHQGEIRGNIFRAGIYISIASIFYLPSSFMLLVLFYDLIVIRTFNWREFAISFIAFLVPFVYLWAYYFLVDELEIFLNYFVEPKTFLSILEFKLLNWLPSMIMALALLGALIYLFASTTKRTVRQNNLFRVIIGMFIGSVLISLVFSSDFMSASALIWPGVSLILANFLLNIERAWLKESIVYLLLLFILLRDFSGF